MADQRDGNPNLRPGHLLTPSTRKEEQTTRPDHHRDRPVQQHPEPRGGDKPWPTPTSPSPGT